MKVKFKGQLARFGKKVVLCQSFRKIVIAYHAELLELEADVNRRLVAHC